MVMLFPSQFTAESGLVLPAHRAGCYADLSNFPRINLWAAAAGDKIFFQSFLCLVCNILAAFALLIYLIFCHLSRFYHCKERSTETLEPKL
jgi:hypothetical protein